MERLKTLLIAIMLTAIVMGASSDQRVRDASKPIARYETVQQSWASGESGALAPTLSNINMLIERIDVVASNSTNAITYTVTITDQYGSTIMTKASIPENDSTVLLATKATPDFDAIPVNNNLTVTITPSGDPGATGSTVDVIIYGP